MGDSVGLVGLGLMGTAMSTRLLAAGRAVVGFDPSPGARANHEARGGTLAGSAAEVAASSRVVILSLPNGQISRSVCLDDGGVRDGATPATVVVETSTTLPDDAATTAAQLREFSIAFLDAALSGSSDMVARGDTLGMVGGDAAALTVAEPILRTFCKEVRHVGGSGDGMRAKLVVNQILSLNRFALAEGLVLAEKLGLEPEQMLGVLQASAAYSKAMDMWGQRMVERRYSEPVSRIRMHNKDAQLTMDVGRRHGAPMIATTQLNAIVQIALANDLGEADNSVIIEVLRRMAGLGPGLSISSDE
ncbi:MAG: NAD-binding protein [Nitriliruptorales bacterium]|nr:NAD-binding protein [Nitriliruptorales bacterium]